MKSNKDECERILFLDIDGVLNTMEYSRSLIASGKKDTDIDGAIFDPRSIEWLGYIIDETHAKIVFSTSWRLDGSQYMKDLWMRRRLPGEIAGITPHIDRIYFYDIDNKIQYTRHAFGIRGMEIYEWLRMNTNECLKPYTYAILDDENDFLLFQAGHVVLTNPNTGITKEVADKIIQILRS